MPKKFNLSDLLEAAESNEKKSTKSGLHAIDLSDAEPGDCYLLDPEDDIVLVVGFTEVLGQIVDHTVDMCVALSSKMHTEDDDDE